MKNPAKLMRFVGNTSFAMQLGRAAGDLSHEVRGSFDQGIALLKNPAGGLIVQNVTEYAKSLDIDVNEVIGYLALQELAHAGLFASVPWLMPRFEALLGNMRVASPSTWMPWRSRSVRRSPSIRIPWPAR